jgi:hypothetical protein
LRHCEDQGIQAQSQIRAVTIPEALNIGDRRTLNL